MINMATSSAVAKCNTKIKVYPNGKLHITSFSRNIFNTGFEDIRIKENSETEAKLYDTSNPRDDNMKRAKAKIFDIALSNEWSYMITLTLDDNRIDRYNTEKIIKPFRQWLNNMVKRKNLKYLIVPEFHKDGAIHFHGLINDSLDLVFSETYIIPELKKPCKLEIVKKYGYDVSDEKVREVMNISNWKLGFSSAVKIDNNVEAVSKYMTKYTCKNFQKIFGQSFFAGGGVNRDLPCIILIFLFLIL
ncbi:MAG: hypothetical protein IJ262_09160 [Clostridia bacterium]|nr:hypothetical protein [Clostridia bacterium]